ncbi:MAG: YceI family protein [Phaeodactylibacter sp.]|nr:YceI family protein [Phaeodactylibacter sp.]
MSTATEVKTTWGIDASHSEIQFKVKHMMVSTVTGAFNEFEGAVETESEDFEGADIRFSANVASIDTNNGQRDEHLKSDDFFNAARFPKLTFESKSFTKKSNGNYRLVGDLTIRDHTHEVEMDVEYFGTAVDPYGQTKAGFEINGKVSRKDFGLKWNAVTEAGGVVVSDEVRLALNVQLVKQ